MRICLLISVPLPPTEGIGYYVWNLSHFLKEYNHQVQIITRGQPGKPLYEKLDGISIWRPRYYPLYPLHVLVHELFVQRLICRLEPNVDLFHLHTPLPPPIQTQRPILLTVHSMMVADARARGTDTFLDIITGLLAPTSHYIEKRLIRISGAIAAVSKVAAEHVHRDLPTGTHVKIMWNGVDPNFFSPGSHKLLNPNNILFVGRLAPGKGLEDLIQAMLLVVPEYPEVKLSIAGSGLLYKKLSRLIESYGLQNQVVLLGHINSREKLLALYQQAWGLVLPSHHESLPTVILEAMACGTPIIATRVGSVPDVIDDGINGLLVSPKNPRQLAKAICLLFRDSTLRFQLGKAARDTVAKKFSWQFVGNEYIKSYEELLKRE